MQDGSLFLTKMKGDALIPGRMPEPHFWLLIEISPFHSEKIIQALKDFLVLGYTRQEICRRYKISPGYFANALGRLQCVHQTVFQLLPYYRKADCRMSENEEPLQ